MKSIAACVIVCAVALLSFVCGKPQGRRTDAENTSQSAESFFVAHLDGVLHVQYDEMVDKINKTWLKCNETFPVSDYEARVDLFSNANTNEVEPHVGETRKCLANCLMRNMRLMTDDGLDVETYMRHIRKLRLNYTLNLNERSTVEQLMIARAVRIYQLPLLITRDSCYATSIDRKTATTYVYGEKCSQLIESYEQAANECKDIIDPSGDKCDTAWMIQSCMIDSHRTRGFESPFYPIYPEQMRKSPL